MCKTKNTWLYFMLVPFIIGAVIHFVVPIQFILTSNPKIEEVYNTYEIEIEQDTVRAVSFLNNGIIASRIQLYESVRDILIRIFQNAGKYQKIHENKLTLNSAHSIANSNDTQLQQFDLNKSMWYVPGIPSLSAMDQTDRQLYNEVIQIEPFVLSVFNNQLNLYEGLVSIEVGLEEGGCSLFYRYPSQKMDRFSSLNSSIFTEQYNNTLLNYELNNISETVFQRKTELIICEPVFRNSSVSGVSCLTLNLQTIVKSTLAVLNVVEFERSKSTYNVVKPIYENIENHTFPILLFSFSDKNYENVVFEEEKLYQLPSNISYEIFQSKIDFQLYIFRDGGSKTYYVLPIRSKGSENSNTILFMIVQNTFSTADLQFKNRQQNMLITLLVPSVIMLIVASVATLCILKKLLSNLDNAIKKLNDSCSMILKGDLQIQVPAYEQSEDLIDLFDEFRILNDLNKYSEPKYFDLPKPQRLIKYLKCYKLFQKLRYNSANVCQNIADCYLHMQELPNAIRFSQIAVDQDLFDYTKQDNIQAIFKQKSNRKRKASKATRSKEKKLTRRLHKLIVNLYLSFKPGDNTTAQKISFNVDLLRKVSFPRILNIEYMACLIFQIRYKFRNGDMNSLKENLQRLNSLITAYEVEHKRNTEDFEASPEIVKCWYRFIEAQRIRLVEKNTMDAFAMYVRALEGDLFVARNHNLIHEDLSSMLKQYNIDPGFLKKMKYFSQYKKRQEREYIFLIDVSNPQQMDSTDIKNWKKSARELAETIFNKYIKPEDRISIIEFCSDIKIVSNLIEKRSQTKIIKKQLLNSIKCKEAKCNSFPIQNLQKAIERVEHLQKEKYFIIFLKRGVQGREVEEIIEQCSKTEFIFIVEDVEQVPNKNEGFYVVDIKNDDDIQRILEEKEHKQVDDFIYLF